MDWLKTTKMIGMDRGQWMDNQRLAKLTERHEALTQTVKRIAHMQQKNEVLILHVIERVDNLAGIAHAHENRIRGLEDGQ